MDKEKELHLKALIRCWQGYQLSITSLELFSSITKRHAARLMKTENLKRFEDKEGNLYILKGDDDLTYVPFDSRLRQNPKLKIKSV